MLHLGQDVTFAHGKEPSVSLRNFSEPEDGFVWSTGRWCEVIFGVAGRPAAKLADLILDLDVFKVPPQVTGQNVFIYLNGLRLSSSLITRRMTHIVSFDPGLLRSGDNVLTIDTPDALCPEELGLNDTRQLGVQLFSVQIQTAQ